MPKEITDIRDFLQKARRRDAKAVTIKTTRGMTKFKIRCSRPTFVHAAGAGRGEGGEARAVAAAGAAAQGRQVNWVGRMLVVMCVGVGRGGGVHEWWRFQIGFW